MTVADIDALLYSAEHPIEALRRAARIPALSPGWQSSMKSLLVAAGEGGRTGNAGLTQAPPAPLSWSGFRCVNVIASSRENADVRSFELGAKDGTPLPPSLPGQHIVVRLRPNPDAPPVARNYSLCGALNGGTYLIAVKNEGGLGSSDELPEHDSNSGEQYEASVVCEELVVSGCDAPELLQFIEETLDEIALLVERLVVGERRAAIGF